MEDKKNDFFHIFSESQTSSTKTKKNINTLLFSEMKPKGSEKSGTKNIFSIIRKNLISIAKEDIKDSKELIIKTYKEDLDLEKLKTTHSLNNIINSEIYNDDDFELNSEEKLDLEYSKNKYAGKDCSSSNLSD